MAIIFTSGLSITKKLFAPSQIEGWNIAMMYTGKKLTNITWTSTNNESVNATFHNNDTVWKIQVY